MPGIELHSGDITKLDVDAIVNAANELLIGGGGVDGAIHAAAGPKLVAASQKLAPCPSGNARLTPGFNLKANFVIHAVGPM
ncbi:macro domain-containing protein, partial [Stieleria sp. JC731]|uniref:macro domain-containing protein n=1 Tax=Stieleria sp. JC731 TaxID=2894195 RepID=UPI001E4415C2